MSGDNLIFNVAKGRIRTLSELSGDQGLLLVLLQSTGLESDATLLDYDTLAQILAASNTEADFTNYARQPLTGVTVTVDDTADEMQIDCDDVTFTDAGNGTNNTMGKALICHDPDTTTGDDTEIIPMGMFSYDGTTDGSTINLVMPADGPMYAA